MSDGRQALLDALTVERFGTGGWFAGAPFTGDGPSRAQVQAALDDLDDEQMGEVA